MRIALLGDEPSLAHYWKASYAEKYSLIIGVNSIGWQYNVHWLVFSELSIWQGCLKRKKLPSVGIVTPLTFPLPKWIKKDNYPLHKTLCRFHEHLPSASPKMECSHDFPNALSFARQQIEPIVPHGTIDVYGFDGLKGDHWATELPWMRHVMGDNVEIYSHLSYSHRVYIGCKGY